MPNHITNKLKINGTPQQIEEVFNRYNSHFKACLNLTHDEMLIICGKEEEGNSLVGWFDAKTGIFTTRDDKKGVVGLPEGWFFEINQPRDYFPDFDKIIKHPRTDAYNDIPTQEAVRDKPDWWMTWNRQNWGTKWNSYSHNKEAFGVYTFCTAWNGVTNLMILLSKQNPEIEFEYSFADEDTGHNVGKFTIKNGEILKSLTPSGGTKEAYDIYFEINPEEKENYILVGNEYHYK